MKHSQPPTRDAFEKYLRENSREDTGAITSYLKGMDLLPIMIKKESEGFGDCQKIWSIQSISRIHELLEKVKEEQNRKENSVWYLEGKKSYLQKGFIKAALGHYRHFLLENQHQEHLLDLFRNHQGDPDELAALLNREPELPDFLEHELEGKEAIRETKVRINQSGFRSMILESYHHRCCITGLDLPELCIASHIIGWAERKDTRMDPRNGLCLTATYDKAFDKHLITLDEDYRLVVSREIREHYRNEHARELFEKREGEVIWMPEDADRRPLQGYLEEHRKKLVS
jgi:putative restriction endonuclease